MITHDPEDIKAFAEDLVTYEAGQVRKVESFPTPEESLKDMQAERLGDPSGMMHHLNLSSARVCSTSSALPENQPILSAGLTSNSGT